MVYFLAIFLAASAYGAENPFSVEIVSVTTTPDTESSVQINVIVPPGYHVYRDMMSVDVIEAKGLVFGEVEFPKGVEKPDPASPGSVREQFGSDVLTTIPVKTPSLEGVYHPVFSVRYQGCKKSLCYMPQTEELTGSVTVKASEAAQEIEKTKPIIP
jgi:thiol:disulfide interchange protein